MRRIVALLAVSAVIMLTVTGLHRAASTHSPSSPADVAASVAVTLRCPTCQGMSIADSPAPVAAGMREIVQEQAAAGREPDEIRAYFVDRYGDWVLLTPPRRGITWLLWLLPAAGMLIGTALAVVLIRRRGQEPSTGGEATLTRARDVYAHYRDGALLPAGTPVGERLEAALELLTAIDEETAHDNDIARQEAPSRVATVLGENEQTA